MINDIPETYFATLYYVGSSHYNFKTCPLFFFLLSQIVWVLFFHKRKRSYLNYAVQFKHIQWL